MTDRRSGFAPTLPFAQRGAFTLPAAAVAFIALNLVALLSGHAGIGRYIALAGLVFLSIPLLLATVREALRGNFATDAVAALSIVTAFALGQPIPGLIIVLMQSGGESLERIAQRKASNALATLEEGAPRIARRLHAGTFTEVEVKSLTPGDVVLIRPGDVVPTDGVVTEGQSGVDTAAITGEPMPLSATAGTRLFSGFVNGTGVLRMQVTAAAADSQYERIVELVRTAQEQKAPIQRLADRYAAWFTPFTVALALIVYFATGDTDRVLAVLVVATPCPLILAAPVAFIGGINRAARARVIFRNAEALERLADIRAVVFDKTGTLTTGRPHASSITAVPPFAQDDVLRAAAAVELGSGHILAQEILELARRQGVDAQFATGIVETPGRGVVGVADGAAIHVGSREFIAEHVSGSALGDMPAAEGAMQSFVAINGQLAGSFVFEDTLRARLPETLDALRNAGIVHLEILSGDDGSTVRSIAAQAGIAHVNANLRPDDKLRHIERIRAAHGATAMVGDGTNDAPALAAADVGIAIAPRTGGVAAETADVILLGDDLGSIPQAISISRRTMLIARQSIAVGLALSVAGMSAASIGWLTPIAGALLQEAIDVAVILNAVRASGDGGSA